MTLNDVKKLRDQIARLPRKTPFRDRPYEAYVRLTDVLALLEDKENDKRRP